MDLDAVKREFENKAHLYEQLKDEALFILKLAISNAKIKLHSTPHRLKNVDSFLDKALRKNSKKPFDDIRDIVGIRVICLFLSDIERIGHVIRESFNVLEEDNKVEAADVSSFGYMSVHFIAAMKMEHSGPRYDPIAKLPFEIQVRTIAMDAWANVSHYLSYKTDKDVPSELRRDFYALSGLFYVADRHFEMFYGSRKQSQENMTVLFETSTLEDLAEQEINLDSLSAYLHIKFADRKHADSTRVSHLVRELTDTGYKTIGEVEKIVEMARYAFHRFEEKNEPPDAGKFADVGVVRVSASIVNDDFIRRVIELDLPTVWSEDEKDEAIQEEIKRYAKYKLMLENKDKAQ